MDLCIVKVRGFRRFRENTTLKTNGKLVALVGPNEAGKSSLLAAISQLGHDEAPNPSDLSRGMDIGDLRIEGHFFLSDEEVRAANLSDSKWLIVLKGAAGTRSFSISPPPSKRDLTQRGKLWQAINFALQNKRLRSRLGEDAEELDETWGDVSPILQGETENLAESDFSIVRDLVEGIVNSTEEGDASTIKKIAGIHLEWEKGERRPNPTDHALSTLEASVPEIIVFDEEDRDLKSEYSISDDLSKDPPVAFQNLCQIADLDIGDLVEAYDAGDTPRLTTLEHAANNNLRNNFGESWKQSGVRVTLRITGDNVAVQVVNEKAEFTSFAERSDGLRQFVALQSFSTCNWSGSPVLLIDEAEQKLHYDAQADLVQMLARQEVASKVIFTTHSAGCLPEDLGNGVRFAKPILGDETRSEIINKFWADNEAGFAPLLFGMGASTLAFFPTRRAVMVEGPADMLVLPTMFREALSTPVLGFQFVPGLSIGDGLFHTPLMGKKSGVLYLTDGDGGGVGIKTDLADKGIDKKNIFTLKTADGNAVEAEDFIDPTLLLEGINRLINKFHGAVEPITKKALAARHRMESAEAWYRKSTGAPLPKVELAYEILDILSDDPVRSILDQKRRSTFLGVASNIMDRFKELRN